MQVFALDDIEPFVECFARYGEEWWVPLTVEEPVPAPRILSDAEYTKLHAAYEEAIYSLYI